LAFAIVLSPALMQMDDTACNVGEAGMLAALDIEVAGQNMIAFNPEQHNYDVLLPEGTESIVVRATATHEDAMVTYTLADPCPPDEAKGEFAPGGGEIILEQVPTGHSVLKVWVQDPVGTLHLTDYVVMFTQPMLCE